jgi:chromosome partitioning protein
MRESIRDRIRSLVATPSARRTYPNGTRNARVLAVAAHKGGVGKTTTAVSLAAAFARKHGKRTLLIDLDPQGHVSASIATMVRGAGSPLSEVLGADDGREVLDAVGKTTCDHLDVTGWDPHLVELEDRLGKRSAPETTLRDALSVTRAHYDMIVIDCPPSLGWLTRNALAAADRVIVPCDLNPLAIRGVDSIVSAIYRTAEQHNPGLRLLGVLLTRVDVRNRSLNDTVEGDLQKRYPQDVLSTKIPITTSFAHAQTAGSDIFTHEPSGRGARAYALLADEVLELIG